MISRVRGDVLAATDQKQTPWDSSSLVGDVYLASAPSEAAPQGTAPTATATASLRRRYRIIPSSTPIAQTALPIRLANNP
jgi:hypothetical protein